MVAADQDFGEIDRPIAVARRAHDGRREQVDAGEIAPIDRVDVLQAAHDAEVGLAGVEAAFSFLPGQIVEEAHRLVDAWSEVGCERATKVGGVVRHE